MNNLLDQLNKTYFWDIDPTHLDEKRSKRLIIERIFNYGNLQEIKLLRDYYGDEEVIATLRKVNYLDPKTLSFVSLMFNIPKSKFKCYTRKLSTTQHWSY